MRCDEQNVNYPRLHHLSRSSKLVFELKRRPYRYKYYRILFGRSHNYSHGRRQSTAATTLSGNVIGIASTE